MLSYRITPQSTVETAECAEFLAEELTPMTASVILLRVAQKLYLSFVCLTVQVQVSGLHPHLGFFSVQQAIQSCLFLMSAGMLPNSYLCPGCQKSKSADYTVKFLIALFSHTGQQSCV